MPGNVAISLALTAVAGLSTSIGGVKDSGWGRHGGLAALEEFTELR